MMKWKIWYDVGFGRKEEEIEADFEDEAGEVAYEAFVEACESALLWGFEKLASSHEVSEGLDEAISEELAEGAASIMKEKGEQ